MTSQTLTSTQERRSYAPYADLGFIRRFRGDYLPRQRDFYVISS